MNEKSKKKTAARKAKNERQARNLMITFTIVFLIMMVVLWAASTLM